MKSIMRNIKILTIATVSLAMVGANSCSDFLEEESKSALAEEVVFAELESIAPLVDGLYTNYNKSRLGREGLTLALGLDESQQGAYQVQSTPAQSGLDKYNSLLTATSTEVNINIWAIRWPIIVTAAKVISLLPMFEQTDEVKGMLGEAHFFRAMGLFELSMFFGEIPIVDVDNIPDAARRPLSEVWTYIIEDFKLAAEYLPETQTDKKRATSGAALAMLGKAYMSVPEETGMRDYTKAKEAFEQMMGRYALVPDYAMLFTNDGNPSVYKANSEEAIFELQYSNIHPACNYWQFQTGSRAVQSLHGDGCYFAGYDFVLPTPFAYNMQADGGLWEDGDKRKDVAIRYDLTYEGTPPALSWTGQADELAPHIRKFEDFRTDNSQGNSVNNMYYSGKNHPLIRLADIYLLYAECLHRENLVGLEGSKEDYVQKVRNRAGLTTPMPSTGDFIKDIMDERMRELCFEGWRRVDLLRTGLFVDLISARNHWAYEEHKGGKIPDFYQRYPIPDEELKTNDDMEDDDQNPGY